MMNNVFLISDKLNSVFKQCYSLFSFQVVGKNYLVYTYSDDDYNYYILVSGVEITSNCEYYLVDITNNEKNFLVNYIHALFIDLPSMYYKGLDYLLLFNDYCKNNSLILLNNVHITGDQTLYSNSLIASTSKIDVDKALYFYSLIYKNYNSLFLKSNNKSVFANVNSDLSTGTVDTSNFIIPISGIKSSREVYNSTPTGTICENNFNNVSNNNIVVNSPSISNYIDKNSHFVLKEKSAGFASSKYIIIGTICLLLAAFVVFISIMIIKNL